MKDRRTAVAMGRGREEFVGGVGEGCRGTGRGVSIGAGAPGRQRRSQRSSARSRRRRSAGAVAHTMQKAKMQCMRHASAAPRASSATAATAESACRMALGHLPGGLFTGRLRAAHLAARGSAIEANAGERAGHFGHLLRGQRGDACAVRAAGSEGSQHGARKPAVTGGLEQGETSAAVT